MKNIEFLPLVNNMAAECLNHKHDIPFKHVAVLVKNMCPILEYSFNHTSNTDLSVHAEIAAIRNFLKKKKFYEDYYLL